MLSCLGPLVAAVLRRVLPAAGIAEGEEGDDDWTGEEEEDQDYLTEDSIDPDDMTYEVSTLALGLCAGCCQVAAFPQIPCYSSVPMSCWCAHAG